MLAVFSKISTQLYCMVATGASLIRSTINANNSILEYLTNGGRTTFDVLANLSVKVRRAIDYSMEDWRSFIGDIVEIISCIVTTVEHVIWQCCNTLCYTWMFIINCMATTGVFIVALVTRLYDVTGTLIVATIWTGSTLIGSLALVGRTIIFIFCLIPRAIVACAQLFFDGIVCSCWALKQSTLNVCNSCAIMAKNFADLTACTIVAIPTDAYWGLALFTFAYFGVKLLIKSQHFHERLARLSNSVKHLFHNFGIARWHRIVNVRGWLYRTPEPEIVVLSSSSSSDDDDDETDGDVGPEVDERPIPVELRRPPGLQRRSTTSEHRMRLRSTASPGKPLIPRMMDEISQLKRELSAEKDSRLCVVCQDKERCTVVLPCRHLCYCRQCSEQIMHRPTCPICRKDVSEHLQIFT